MDCGNTANCKADYAGSIPTPASNKYNEIRFARDFLLLFFVTTIDFYPVMYTKARPCCVQPLIPAR